MKTAIVISMTITYQELGEIRSVTDLLIPQMLKPAISLILLLSSLTFNSFYWFEAIEYLGNQEQFNKAMECYNREIRGDGQMVELVYISEHFLFLGLFMIAIVAIILTFANISRVTQIDAFRQFLQANLLFWLFNLVGNRILEKRYRPHSEPIKRVKESSRGAEYQQAYDWYRSHIWSEYFLVYAGISFVLILIILVLDYVLDRPWGYRFIVSVAYLIITLVGCLYFRAGFHDRWLRRNDNKTQ